MPPELEVLNYMNVLFVNQENIYLSGGISKDLKKIKPHAYIYNPSHHIAQKLPDMKQPRYTHMGILFQDKYFIFGGRYYGIDKIGILKHCEYFDFNTWQWYTIAPMLKRRCTGCVLCLNDELYVFGGYTGNKTRDRLIEKYDMENN